ncbi:MAG: ABC transporter ATP-binding protein [Lachnospiraceae bacterium]|jgi:NitT/TauT family transport system ATP-binding protein|nr:ABC transporter ATP-binding protein [Lachnospiraceae bacterium]
MTEQPKVSAQRLTKKFGDLLVLNDVSFDIKKGEFVCLVGPTGCGKTTFLNLLVKLTEPTSGNVLIDGVPADPQKHNMSFVFQEPSTFPWLTVEDNIKFNLEIKKIEKQEIQKRTEHILEMIGLTEQRNAYPGQLSVSAEQRIVIGRSFAMYPDLLLMDEPYGQMDIKLRYYLEDAVLKLWRETESTIIFITHNIEEAVYLSQRCLIMTPKPTTIKASIENPLPYPRNVSDPEFIKLREQITDMIKWW